MGSVVNRISKTATGALFWSDLNEQRERKYDRGGLALNQKTMLTLIVAVIACLSMAMVATPSDAADGPTYGSNVEPYGGMNVDYDALENGATYHIIRSGTVYIFYGEEDVGDLSSQLTGTGLTDNTSNGSVQGTLEQSVELTIGQKTINLIATDSVFGEYPTYAAAIDPFPEATVGTFYHESIIVAELGGYVAPDTREYHINESSEDLAEYNLSISFSSERVNNARWKVIATISGTPVSSGTITMEIWSNNRSTYHTEYTTSITINNPVYTITFDPGSGTCNTQTMTYSSVQDDLELPNATPPQGYHFLGWYTDPSEGLRVGGYGDNPFDVFVPNGNFTLYAHYGEDTNPVTNITISGSASIGIGESTVLNALSTLLHPDEDGNRRVVWDLIDGEGVVSWGSEVILETGGRITVTGLSQGTATFRAMAADGSTDADGERVCDYFTISVSSSPSVERNTFTLIYRPTISNVSNVPPTFSTTSTQSYYETQVSAIHPYHSSNTFLGWSYNSSASTVNIEPGDPISLPPGTTYLYAVWEPIQTMWTLSFDPNGGTGGPSQIQEYETGLSHTFRLPGSQYNPNPPDASKEFGGWSREPNSQIVAAYPGGSLYTTTQETTLYAIWNDVSEYNEFVLHYDANRGTGAPSDSDPIYSADNSTILNISPTEPVRPGYDFSGWSLNPYWNEGDDYYPSNGSILVYPGTTTLYAIWIQTNFTITFDPNNGTGGPGVIIASGSGAAQVMIPTSPDPTRDGYTFLGWSLEPNGQVDPEYAKGRLVTLNSNITLYAVWSQNSQPGGGEGEEPVQIEYEFHFIVGEGVENVPDDLIVQGDQNGVTFTFPENILETDGLTFIGWSNIENSESAAWFPDESYHFDSEHRVNYFYPVWERGVNTWSLSFHPNGGIGGPSTQYATDDGDSHQFEIAAEPRPTRAGHTFLGWDADPNVNSPSIRYSESGMVYIATTTEFPDRNAVLYAIWAEGNEDTFTLSFDTNGGTDGPGPISEQDVGSHRFTIPLQYPNMDGMIFVGWSDSPTGGIVAYVGGTYVASSQDVTLYAIWQTDDGTSKNFTVIYQPYPDADPIERLIASNGGSAIHTLMTEDDEGFVQRSGYEFVGWSETEGGRVIEGTTYSTGAMFVVLYGVWSSTSSTFPEAQIEYTVDGLTVTFDGSMSPNALTWFWDVDGTRYGTSSFQHTFSESGTYLVSLTVTNGAQQDVKRIYVTVEDDGRLSILTYVAIIAVIVIMVIIILRYKGVI